MNGEEAAAGSAGGGIVVLVLLLGFGALMIASAWKVFTKAGQPGWASIVPIYNIIVLLQITGKPLWWIALLCVPFVNLYAAVVLCLALARSFGKGTGFGVGLLLLSPVFYPLLAFGDAKYMGPAGAPVESQLPEAMIAA